jgi:hypothetical protein
MKARDGLGPLRGAGYRLLQPDVRPEQAYARSPKVGDKRLIHQEFVNRSSVGLILTQDARGESL